MGLFVLVKFNYLKIIYLFQFSNYEDDSTGKEVATSQSFSLLQSTSLPPIFSPALNINRSPPIITSFVPQSEEQISAIVATILDIYWNERRCGQPWFDLQAPETFLESDEEVLSEHGASSMKWYKAFLFDLVGEVLVSMYSIENDDDDPDPPPDDVGSLGCSLSRYLAAERLIDRRMLMDKNSLPTTIDDLRPILTRCILRLVNPPPPKNNHPVSSLQSLKALSCPNKNESIMFLLGVEMRVEEASWNNIDAELQEVKEDVFEWVLQWLIHDTLTNVTQAFNSKNP